MRAPMRALTRPSRPWALALASAALLLVALAPPLAADLGRLTLGELALRSTTGATAAEVARGALLPGESFAAQVVVEQQGGSALSLDWTLELSAAGGGAAPLVLASGSDWSLAASSARELHVRAQLPAGLPRDRYLLELNLRGPSGADSPLSTVRELYVGRAAELELDRLEVEGLAPGAVIEGGERLSCSVRVRNRGLLGAPASSLDLRFSRNEAITAQDPGAGQVRLAALAAGAERRERFDLIVPASLAPGSYYLGARVDVAREVEELVEGGQACSAAAYRLRVPEGPDLTALSVASRSARVAPGGLVRIERRLANAGRVASGTVHYALYLSADERLDASDREVFRGTLASLAGGAESTAEVEIRLPATIRPGAYRLGLRVDPDDALLEAREDDNAVLAAEWLEVRAGDALPDLRVLSLRPNHYTTRPGDRLEVNRSIVNAGGADAGPFAYTLVLSSDERIGSEDPVVYRYRYAQGLARGAQRSGQVQVTIPSDLRPGRYWVGLRLDSEDEVAEADEAGQDLLAPVAIRVERGEGVLRVAPSAAYMNDGDTLRIAGQSYRLLGYDTPEKRSPSFDSDQEPYASHASDYARSLLAGAEELALHLGPSDRYGRRLAHAFVDGRSLAVLMVEAEHAYETIRIFGNGGFYELSGEILAAARGRTPPFEAPYRWRQAHSTR